MNRILVVIPYLASAAQGDELRLAVTGWRMHFKVPYLIAVVGDHHPIVETGNDIMFIECPRVEPVPGQYLPHLDHVHKFRKVRESFQDTEGFIYTCDDIYAVADFTMEDILEPKHPELGAYIKPYDWNSNAADWWSDRGKTAELCVREGLPARDWVCHLPVYYEWDKLFAIYDKYDCDHNSYIVENIYFSMLYGDRRSFPAADYRYEVKTANPGGRPLTGVKWITNQNCGWSKALEKILRDHYGIGER